MTAPPPAPAGWYPDPASGGRRYWDGATWGPVVTLGGPSPQTINPDPQFLPPPSPAAAAAAAQHPADQKSKAVSIGVILLAVIGLVMSMQSVSLMSGTGTLWTGVGLAAAGTAAAFFLGAENPTRIIAAICLAAALLSVMYAESQISQKRSEISDIFKN